MIEDVLEYLSERHDSLPFFLCHHDSATMFVQAACLFDENQMMKRKKQSLLLGCLGVFIALFVINYNDYLRKMTEYGFLLWDIKTVTASDYTVEFDIQPEFYEDYCEKEMESWIRHSEREGQRYLS